MRTIYILKENFDTNYQYRKAIKEYRDRGYSMVKVMADMAAQNVNRNGGDIVHVGDGAERG